MREQLRQTIYLCGNGSHGGPSQEFAARERQSQLPVTEGIGSRSVVTKALEAPRADYDFDQDEFRQQPPAAAARGCVQHLLSPDCKKVPGNSPRRAAVTLYLLGTAKPPCIVPWVVPPLPSPMSTDVPVVAGPKPGVMMGVPALSFE
jgi:hypothetical protein